MYLNIVPAIIFLVFAAQRHQLVHSADLMTKTLFKALLDPMYITLKIKTGHVVIQISFPS